MNSRVFAGFYSLLKKEVLRFYRVAGQTIFSPLINAALYLLIFGVNLADKIDTMNGVNYLLFIIPGLMAMGLLNNAFQNASSSIITSKFHGDFQDLRVVPLQPLQIVAAYGLAATLRGALVGICVGIVGELFHYIMYGSLIPIAASGWLILFIVMGGLTFGFLGLCIAIFSTSFDQVSAISTFVILPLIYLGGVFFSTESMHPFWQKLSYLNPLFYIINGVRYGVLGISDLAPQVSFLFATVFILLAGGLAFWAVKKGSYTKF